MKYRFWNKESKCEDKTKMDPKYWTVNVWTERIRITVGCSGGSFWTLVRNSSYRFQWRVVLNTGRYLQASVVVAFEDCFILTGSIGESF